MADLEGQVFAHEWELPQESAQGMLVYAMTQELATWLHYRNLRERVREHGGDSPCASGRLAMRTEARDRSRQLRFANLRAHAYWALREALDPKLGDARSGCLRPGVGYRD
jgi:hypothetical protein